MSSVDDFKKTMSACNEIPADQVQSLSMPVNVIAQEAQNLYEVALDDKEELAKAGMDVQLIDRLREAGMFLRYTEADWTNVRAERAEARKLWNEKAPTGFELLKMIVHSYRFAFRSREDILALVREIADGGSNADMIQDLFNCNVLGKKHPEELEKIGFDFTLLDTAEKTAAELTDLLGKANHNSSAENESRDLRDRAFTHLKAMMAEIREYGKFVYHQDKKRMREYASAYLRKNNLSSKKSKAAETEEMQEAA